MKTITIAVLFSTLCLSGCGIIYTNVRVPRAYRSSVPSEVKSTSQDPVVSGKSCNHSALFLVAWGDASYAAAAKNALGGDSEGVLYDVKSDMQALSILGIYTRTCTILTGKVGRIR